MRRLTCSKDVSYILHTEDYTNAGLKQEDMMKQIEKCVIGVSSARKYPINHNIKIYIKLGYSISDVIEDIYI